MGRLPEGLMQHMVVVASAYEHNGAAGLVGVPPGWRPCCAGGTVGRAAGGRSRRAWVR